MTLYYPGSGIRIAVEVRNEAGALVNPATITITHRDPALGTDEITPVNDEVGKYHGDYTFDTTDANGTAINEFLCVTTSPDSAMKLQVRVLPL